MRGGDDVGGDAGSEVFLGRGSECFFDDGGRRDCGYLDEGGEEYAYGAFLGRGVNGYWGRATGECGDDATVGV